MYLELYCCLQVEFDELRRALLCYLEEFGDLPAGSGVCIPTWNYFSVQLRDLVAGSYVRH